MSPRKRTSPWRPSSAKATEIFSLDVSRPTNTLLLCGMARPLCGRLGAGPSGTTLARRIVGTSHLRRHRTYGLPLDLRSGRVAPLLPAGDLARQGVLMGDAARQALARQDAQLDLSHVEPGAGLRCVMDLKAVG